MTKPGWQWRALRLLSRKSRHLFEQTQTPARKIPDYLEDIMRKLAKEITVCAATTEYLPSLIQLIFVSHIAEDNMFLPSC